MTLSGHEAFELNELLMSCVNTINCMGVFTHQAQDPQLKSLIQGHLNVHVQDYNIKVEWATQQASTQKLNVPAAPFQALGGHVKPQSVTPNPQATSFDDRAIATSYLLTLKRAGREYAWATMESANPDLRNFLKDAFNMAATHAFEVSQWMAKKGFYPSEPASATYLQTLGQTYLPVRQMAGVR